MFHVSIWGLGALFGGLSPPKTFRGDGTRDWAECGQKLNKLQITFFSYKLLWISVAHAINITVVSKGIEITLQWTYSAVNYSLGESAQWQRKFQNSKPNRKT